jgi:hypothetical protein
MSVSRNRNIAFVILPPVRRWGVPEHQKTPVANRTEKTFEIVRPFSFRSHFDDGSEPSGRGFAGTLGGSARFLFRPSLIRRGGG